MNRTNAALSPLGIQSLGPTVGDLPAEAQAFMLRRGTVRIWRHGEAVQEHLVPVRHMSWIKAGRLRSTLTQSDGVVQSVGWVMQSELIGMAGLLTGTPSRVTLRVDTATATVVQIDRATLEDLINQVPGVGLGLAVGMSRRQDQLFDIIDVGRPRLLIEKLRAVLVWWTRYFGVAARDGSVELWVSQSDLADAVGASRQRVHSELKRLQDMQEVELAYRKLIVRPLFFKKLGSAVSSDPKDLQRGR